MIARRVFDPSQFRGLLHISKESHPPFPDEHFQVHFLTSRWLHTSRFHIFLTLLLTRFVTLRFHLHGLAITSSVHLHAPAESFQYFQV